MVIHCQHINASVIAHFFVRRKQPMQTVAPEPAPPPPPPPKDTPCRDATKPLPALQLDHLADISVASSTEHLRYPPSPPMKLVSPRTLPRPRLTPEERLKRRLSSQRRREREEQDAIREERERQARQRREKEESEQRAREDEERRKAMLQDQLRQAAARKAREEREAKATEERRLREIKEHKQTAHERRLQYSRELQKWRHEQIRRAESQSSEKEEERKRAAEERRSRLTRMSDVLLQDDEAFSGWVTVQTPDHLTWKRRYFMFDLAHGQLSLCRNQRDSTRSVELVNLDGQVESLNEWYEGFEELEAIPYSFAVKFVDGRTWFLYADTEQDKDRLLLLLSEAAGVII